MLPIRNPLQVKRNIEIENKIIEKKHFMQMETKKSGAGILIPGKNRF